MFCEKCGKPNEDGVRFCEFCGAPMAEEAVAAAAAAPVATAPAVPKVTLMDKIKAVHQKNKLLLPIIAAALVVVIVVGIVLAVVLTNNAKKVEMADYVKVEVSGCDGYGNITYEFDSFSFFLRLTGDKSASGYGAIDPDTFPEEQREPIQQQAMKYKALLNSVDVTLELPEGRTDDTLHNGDKVTVKVTCDTTKAEGLDANIITGEFTYEVKDLEAPKTFNVLDYYEVVFDGYDGYGSYELVCKESAVVQLGKIAVETKADESYITVHISDEDGGWENTYYVEVTADSYRNLSNGDTLTLSVPYLDEDEYTEYGVIMENLEQEITVSGLKEAVEVNLWEYYEFVSSGMDGSGSLYINRPGEPVTVGELEFHLDDNSVYCNGDYISSIYPNVSDNWGLSNGDVVTVSLSFYEEDLARYGVVITDGSIEVTVSGLGVYAADLESVKNAGNFAEVEAKGQEVIMNYLYDDWNRAVHNDWKDYSEIVIGDDMALYKAILTTPKSTSSWDHNTLWLIYSVTLDDDAMDPTVYYFAVRVEDVVVNGDGSLDTEDLYYNYYRGYTVYEEFYNDYIGADSFKLNIFE